MANFLIRSIKYEIILLQLHVGYVYITVRKSYILKILSACYSVSDVSSDGHY
jgi:hypothetical protein